MVSWSKQATISQRTFPSGVCMSIALWPTNPNYKYMCNVLDVMDHLEKCAFYLPLG